MSYLSTSEQVRRCFLTRMWLNSVLLWASSGPVLVFSLKRALFSIICPRQDAEEEPGSQLLGVKGVARPEAGWEQCPLRV